MVLFEQINTARTYMSARNCCKYASDKLNSGQREKLIPPNLLTFSPYFLTKGRLVWLRFNGARLWQARGENCTLIRISTFHNKTHLMLLCRGHCDCES